MAANQGLELIPCVANNARMARHWREPLDASRHVDRVADSLRFMPKDRLVPAWSYFVHVHGFTFEFSSVEQLAECLGWFRRYSPRSSADWWYTTGYEHFPRWFERLPPGLTRKSRLPEIVKAMEDALVDFGPPKPKSERQYSRATVLRAIREHGPSWENKPVVLPRVDPFDESFVKHLLMIYGVDWNAVAHTLTPVSGNE